jgi:hypothetical protein
MAGISQPPFFSVGPVKVNFPHFSLQLNKFTPPPPPPPAELGSGFPRFAGTVSSFLACFRDGSFPGFFLFLWSPIEAPRRLFSATMFAARGLFTGLLKSRPWPLLSPVCSILSADVFRSPFGVSPQKEYKRFTYIGGFICR